jgi:predicted AAA+ superfamily ATPase
MRALPNNVLIYATARAALEPNGADFALKLRFPKPNLAEFVALTCELLELAGLRYHKQAVHAACVDYQVDAQEALSFSGAQHVARLYARA